MVSDMTQNRHRSQNRQVMCFVWLLIQPLSANAKLVLSSELTLLIPTLRWPKLTKIFPHHFQKPIIFPFSWKLLFLKWDCQCSAPLKHWPFLFIVCLSFPSPSSPLASVFKELSCFFKLVYLNQYISFMFTSNAPLGECSRELCPLDPPDSAPPAALR